MPPRPPKVSNPPPPATPTRYLSLHPDGLLLAVKLQPRAPANEILGPLGEELRIRVTAPPVDAAANEALLRLLAEKLQCSRSQIELFRGHTARHKLIKLRGISLAQATARLV